MRSTLAPLAAVIMVLALGCSSDDGGSGDNPDAATGSLPFMSECTADEDCQSGLCFEFNAKGDFCTQACENDLECEDPSPGCNGKGVCKAPDGDGDGGGGGGGGGG
jgi:hypothetical protein